MDSTRHRMSEQLEQLNRSWNDFEAAGAETALRALLPEAQSLTGKDRCHLVEVWSMIARETSQARMPEAHGSLHTAEKLLEDLKDMNPNASTARVRWLLEKGRYHMKERTPSHARTLFAERGTWPTSFGMIR